MPYRTSLRELATAWPRLLRRPHLAQSAWQVLTQHVQDSVRRRDPYRAKALLGLIYRALTPDQADATVLRYLLELTVDQTADLMGADPAAVAYWLRSAQRRLGRTSTARSGAQRPSAPSNAVLLRVSGMRPRRGVEPQQHWSDPAMSHVS